MDERDANILTGILRELSDLRRERAAQRAALALLIATYPELRGPLADVRRRDAEIGLRVAGVELMVSALQRQ